MSRARPAITERRHMAGLSLIELMIALVLALIVAAGIITVFTSTSSSNKAQVQMATLQEEGRFAIHSLVTDLGNANSAYCSNSGGNAINTAATGGSGLLLDGLRSPIVYANTPITFPDNTVAIAAASEPYVLPSDIFMRGYECPATGGCTPVDPNTSVPGIPPMGTAVGDRVVGADVLTIRYLRPDSGWAIVPAGSHDGSTIDPSGGGGAGGGLTINLNPLPGEPPVSDFHSGDLALIATCSGGGIYNVSATGSQLQATSANYAQPTDISAGKQAAPRVFDFTRDFQTVTYYLKVVCSNGETTPGAACASPYHTLGELVRRVNGTDQPLARGVERLDFRYGVIGGNGETQYLTADEVDTATNAGGGTIACPPTMPPLAGVLPDPPDGCLWRAVQTIQVNILMDGQTPLYTLTPDELKYIYSPDGDNTPIAPSAHPVQPKATQGFPDHMLRREFTTVVALRNFNP